MKTNLFLLVCGSLLAGCQTVRPAIKPLPDPLPLRQQPANYAGHAPVNAPPTVTVSVVPPSPKTPEELTRQNQIIEALIAQNDALMARVHQLEAETAAPVACAAPLPAAAPVSPTPVSSASAAPQPSAAPVVTSALAPGPAVTPPAGLPELASEMPLLVPNADGVIDVTALEAPPPGTPPNPFAVRAPTAGAGRDITLRVQGIVTGENRSALVNDRVVECGQRVECLTLTRLLPDALVLTGEGFAINLPLGATKIRMF